VRINTGRGSSVDPVLLIEKVDGPRLLLLGGRSWRVMWTDWTRRRCYVEQVDEGGRARWTPFASSGASFALTRAVRDVLLGAVAPVAMTQRAIEGLGRVRETHLGDVHPGGTVISRDASGVSWWTWSGYRANVTLAATLSDLADFAVLSGHATSGDRRPGYRVCRPTCWTWPDAGAIRRPAGMCTNESRRCAVRVGPSPAAGSGCGWL
jgi:hypothetical protein